MILALDIGNTNIVMGCFDGEEIYFTSRIATDLKKTEAEYAISIKNILELHRVTLGDVHGSIVSSVVPPVLGVVRQALVLTLGAEPLVVGPGVKTGLNIQMENPAALGSDLVVDAVAAMHEHPVPLVVVDLGTATTLSVLDGRRRYIGSIIAPGVSLSATAMAAACAQLPGFPLEAPRFLVGRNTVEGMKSGAVFGAAAMLDGLIARIEEKLGEPVTVVATGGLAEIIVPWCRREMVRDDLLMLKGLRLIYEKNLDPKGPLDGAEEAKKGPAPFR